MNKEVILSLRELRDSRLGNTENSNEDSWGHIPTEPEQAFVLDDFITEVEENVDRIDGLFPVGKVTLLYGAIGSGKSYMALSIMSEQGVVPYYINLDATGGLDEFEKHQLDEDFIVPLFEGRADDVVRGSVVIIDTYTKLMDHPHFRNLTDEQIVARFEELAVCAGVTLIIIGHAEEFVGSSNIFQSNVPLQRSVYESILINKKHREKTREYKKGFYFDVRILKGRGIGGAQEVPRLSRIASDASMDGLLAKAKEL